MFPVFLECSFISIHALREEGDTGKGGRTNFKAISIHALREEGDDSTYKIWLNGTGISIHALREEGDVKHVTVERQQQNFYPRPPRGGRPP